VSRWRSGCAAACASLCLFEVCALSRIRRCRALTCASVPSRSPRRAANPFAAAPAAAANPFASPGAAANPFAPKPAAGSPFGACAAWAGHTGGRSPAVCWLMVRRLACHFAALAPRAADAPPGRLPAHRVVAWSCHEAGVLLPVPDYACSPSATRCCQPLCRCSSRCVPSSTPVALSGLRARAQACRLVVVCGAWCRCVFVVLPLSVVREALRREVCSSHSACCVTGGRVGGTNSSGVAVTRRGRRTRQQPVPSSVDRAPSTIQSRGAPARSTVPTAPHPSLELRHPLPRSDQPPSQRHPRPVDRPVVLPRLHYHWRVLLCRFSPRVPRPCTLSPVQPIPLPRPRLPLQRLTRSPHQRQPIPSQPPPQRTRSVSDAVTLQCCENSVRPGGQQRPCSCLRHALWREPGMLPVPVLLRCPACPRMRHTYPDRAVVRSLRIYQQYSNFFLRELLLCCH